MNRLCGTSHVSILNTVRYSSEKWSNTSENVAEGYNFVFFEVKLLLEDIVQETDGQKVNIEVPLIHLLHNL